MGFKLPIKIGTRGSSLALAQANQVRDRLLESSARLRDEDIEIVTITTSGDKFLEQDLALIGGKGLFTKEIEEALLGGDIDLAIHSMKDVPAILPDGLAINSILTREDVHDAFISNKYKNISELPEGAVIGTSSIRRKAILKNHRADLNIISFRGNVNSRLRKLEEQEVDGIILAVAGLKRISLEGRITEKLKSDFMLPAIGQGAIGIESRVSDLELNKILREINDEKSERCINLERIFMEKVDGSCRTPIACLVEEVEGSLNIRSLIIHPEGEDKFYQEKLVNVAEGRKAILDMVERAKIDAAEILKFINDSK